MVARRVRTLFVQTGRWNPPALARPAELEVLVERAHARGMAVSGWYRPRFADIDHDVRASLAALEPSHPQGSGSAASPPTSRIAARLPTTFPASTTASSGTHGRCGPPSGPGRFSGQSSWTPRTTPARLRWEGIPRDRGLLRSGLPVAYWTVTKGRGPGADAGTYLREVRGPHPRPDGGRPTAACGASPHASSLGRSTASSTRSAKLVRSAGASTTSPPSAGVPTGMRCGVRSLA